MEEGFVTLASGLALSYASRGSVDQPTVVVLPGPTDSWRSYEGVLQRMSATRAIAVSQRGHGDSDKPATGYSVHDYANDVVQFLDALAIDRAVLAGHSGSCMTARRVALDHPDRVAGLVLEASPTTLVGDRALEDFASSVISALRDPIDPDFVRDWIRGTSSDNAAEGLDTDLLVAEVLKVPARVWQQTLVALVTYDDRAELSGIDAPTRLIWGDADGLVTEAAQHALLDLIQSASLSMFVGAGHAPRWDDPDRFAAEVEAFARGCK